jgi:formylaminopyrimidine deformylase / aminopyrimidine aminohydrolase
VTSATTPLSPTSLVEGFAAEWVAATRHAFLEAVADGSLPPTAFNTWLAQDYLFVADLLVFQARLLGRAPRSDQAVLAGGLVALEAELGWFEARAAQRRLVLDTSRAATTARYQAILQALDGAPYAAAVTGLWAIERAYLDSWRSAVPCGAAYKEFVEHWTVDGFADYVAGLEQVANLALQTANVEVRAQAGKAFVEIARLERAFWDMAWSERSA